MILECSYSLNYYRYVNASETVRVVQSVITIFEIAKPQFFRQDQYHELYCDHRSQPPVTDAACQLRVKYRITE